MKFPTTLSQELQNKWECLRHFLSAQAPQEATIGAARECLSQLREVDGAAHGVDEYGINQLAYLLFQQGDYRRACSLMALLVAAAVHPKPLLALALILEKRRAWQAAERAYALYSLLEPSLAWPYFRRGVCLFHEGSGKEARSLWQQAYHHAELNPNLQSFQSRILLFLLLK